MGEDNETYLVRIQSGITILAEYEVQTPQFSYPAAAQVSDGASGAFTIAVAQVSARFGPGPFRQTAVGV